MDRKKVFEVIEEERDYQDLVWGGHNHDKFHEPEAWLVYIEYYLNKAKAVLSTEHTSKAYPEAMDSMRKIAALSVACMENFGAPRRNNHKCSCGDGAACSDCNCVIDVEPEMEDR